MTARWLHPLHELATIRAEVERRLHDQRDHPATESAPVTAGAWCPPIDVEETPEAFVLYAELPGVSAQALDVSVDGRMLRITGDRAFYGGKDTDAFRRVERAFGRFDRRVRLPADADSDQIEAAYADGILVVRVPKTVESRRTTIRVSSENQPPRA